jgi:ABC-2 type transport system permease protein
VGTVLLTLRTAFRDAFTNRRSFWVQVLAMAANDLAWVGFWLLFFHKMGDVQGWDADRVILLFAILATASGTALGLFANARRIGELIGDGQLDAALSLPVEPLPYLLTRRIDTVLLGDLLFGPLLFLIAGNPTPERALVFVLSSALAAIVLVGFLVFAGSLTFFIGGRGAQSDIAFQAVLLLSSYPLDVFGGITRLLLFSAIPAAFVTGLPVRLVDSFDPAVALVLAAVAASMAGLGALVFRLGLRRYASGAVFTRA